MGRGRGKIVAGMITALIVGMLSGCFPAESQNIVFDSDMDSIQPETTLTFFGYKYEPLNVIAIEEAMHSYMDEYPEIAIYYDGIKSPEYFEVLEKRMRTGNGDDIIMVDHEQVLTLRNQGALADLADLSTLKNFSELAWSQMSVGGIIDYVPTSISAFGLYCNLDMLKAHGKQIPTNLEEFAAVCDYFTAQGIVPIVANNDISLKTIAIAKGMYPYYQQDNPAQALEAFNSGKANLAEALLPGFELVETMLKQGWVDSKEALAAAKTKDDLTLFAAGDRPFMLTGAWAVPRLRDLSLDFAFEVMPYPILDDGSVLVVNVDTRISVRADSPNLEAAKQFVEYLTRQDVMWDFVNSQSSFSPLVENRLAEDKAIQSIGPYLSNGRSVIGSDDNLQIPIWTIMRKCVAGMLKGDDARTAASHMEEQINVWSSSDGGDVQ